MSENTWAMPKTTAADAPSALELLQGGVSVDVLFTDVVMPGGMSGVQLAEAAIQLRPKLSVLLTSGYLGSAAASTKTGFHLIDKPYDPADLAQRLASLLSAPAGAAAAKPVRKPAGKAEKTSRRKSATA